MCIWSRLQSPFRRVQSKNGVVIDCVYIHKQPSMKHPLFKDHKIQVNASSVLHSHTPVYNTDSCRGRTLYAYAHDRAARVTYAGLCPATAAARSWTLEARVAYEWELSCGNSPHSADAEGRYLVGRRCHGLVLSG
jgi:hypothetical protein